VLFLFARQGNGFRSCTKRVIIINIKAWHTRELLLERESFDSKAVAISMQINRSIKRQLDLIRINYSGRVAVEEAAQYFSPRRSLTL
jgi:Iap family predicted aminopeptidase